MMSMTINISLQNGDEDDVFDNEDLVVSADSTSYEFSGDLLEPGQKYTFMLNGRCDRSSNPEGFRRGHRLMMNLFYLPMHPPLRHWIWKCWGRHWSLMARFTSQEDSVKETLIFENANVTSIFDEGEGQESFTSKA